MQTRHSSCTTILVGKKASIDGSVMAGRNDMSFLFHAVIHRVGGY